MRNGVIYFTNLGIVKSNEFEFTNDRFFNNMENMIATKPKQYSVAYDKEKNEYKIVYDNRAYSVILGKDGYLERTTIVDMLNKLVKNSTSYDEIRKEEDEKNQYIAEKREQIFDNARKGIIRTNDEKRAAIKINDDKYRNEKYKFWNGVFKIFKKINWGDKKLLFSIVDVIAVLLSIIIGASASLLGLVTLELVAKITAGCAFTSLFGTVLINSIIDDVSCTNFDEGINGIWPFIFSLVTLPFNITYNLVKKIISVVKHYSIKKDLQKGIYDFNYRRKKTKSKKSIDEVNKYINEIALKNMNDAPTNMHKTIDAVTSLKDKILEVKDSRLSKKFAKELYEIINYYIDASLNIKEKDKVSNILSNQLIDLTRRVDDVLEKENNKNNEGCNNLIETIDYQKSIGTR